MPLTAIPYTAPADTVTTSLADTASQTTATDITGAAATGLTTVVTTLDPTVLTTTAGPTTTATTGTGTDTSAITAEPILLTTTTTATTTTDTPADTVSVTTGTGMFAAPVITDIMALDSNGTPTRVFDGSQISDAMPTLKGTAMPGSDVGIFDQGTLLGKTTADSDWAWSFQPVAWQGDATASTGLHSFSAAHMNADGSSSLPSVYSYDCAINAAPRPLLVPVITQVNDNTSATPNNVLDSTAPLGDTTPDFQGTSQPGTLVTLYDNGAKVAQVTTGADWLWHVALNDPLLAGNHTVSVEATYPDGKGPSASYQYSYVVEGGAALNSTAIVTDTTTIPAATTTTTTTTVPAADTVTVAAPAILLDNTASTSLEQLLTNAGLTTTGSTTTGSSTDALIPVAQTASVHLAVHSLHDLAY